jgi:glycosyltransferase involved in cell wall biosynthesis
MTMQEPYVSIITPVYNGEMYLAECIESVLAQTHQNWDYTIVNNCSTDKSLAIAQAYAGKDKRIKVVNNTHFVGIIDNHNIAFRSISEQSKYCKLVSADDWLYPECITNLVKLAESNPKIGIVGSYVICSNGVIRQVRIPLGTDVFSGSTICRYYLLNTIPAFWTPSCVLYRSELVRSQANFFPGSAPSADLAAFLESLKSWDYGFVRQILSFERIHDEAASHKLTEFDSYTIDRIEFLMQYGPTYLKPEEIEYRKKTLFQEYHKNLAIAAINIRDSEFWRFHKSRIEALGYPFYSFGLAKAILLKFMDIIFNPMLSVERVLRRFTTHSGTGIK